MNHLLTLASRPFIDPIELHTQWYLLLIPMAFFASLAYKAVRVWDVKTLPRQVLAMTLQVILAMAGLGLAVYIFVEVALPLIAPK
ncbi:hypothetical protein LBMAG48_06150 [Phycisphaerae bacterium]|jgi:hypothetical protein|nr:hypothetical protein LBMAG48_06150 [Phycisphaerae bacterium]